MVEKEKIRVWDGRINGMVFQFRVDFEDKGGR